MEQIKEIKAESNTKKGVGRPSFEEETRSERVNFMLTPSLKEMLRQAAKMKQTSINSLLFDISKEWVEANEDSIEDFSAKYAEFMKSFSENSKN